MKKLILTLVVLAMAAPLYAAGGIDFVATDNVDGTCTITFTATDPCIPPVALGVNVKVTGSDPCHLITAVSGMDSFFEIFMDHAYDDPCNYTYGAGDPVADPCAAGSASLPSHHFCISMGGLGGPTKPLTLVAPTSGTAFVLTAGNLTDPCDTVTGHIKINALRGGVIGKDTNPMTTNLVPEHLPFTITTSGDCYPSDAPGYQTWLDFGKPDCWCYQYNCKGDTDNIGTGLNLNKKYVVLADLTLLSNSWAKKQSDPTLPSNYQCANFDRVGTGLNLNKKWVVLGDLTILSNGWAKKVSDPIFATNPCPINGEYVVP